MPNEDIRTLVTEESRTRAEMQFHAKLEYRLKQKGSGTFASRHEILGILTEEFKELIDAVQSNIVNDFEQELLDIMIGAFWGLASSKNGTLDW